MEDRQISSKPKPNSESRDAVCVRFAMTRMTTCVSSPPFSCFIIWHVVFNDYYVVKERSKKCSRRGYQPT